MKSDKTYQLKVTLLETMPVVWRNLLIPASYNFYQLHMAVKAAFGWENAHLFQFGKNGLADKVGIGIPNDSYPVRDARKVILKNTLKKPGDAITYIYDFGDHWKHEINLEAVTTENVGVAVCTDGAGECPPEDVGGTIGYERMLEVFKSGRKEEREDYREWLGMRKDETWDPEYYNQREVNKRMCLLFDEQFTFEN